MKRLIYLSLVLVLAACGTTPQPPGNNNVDGDGNGGRPPCDDGAHGEITTAMLIEFGKAYEVRSGGSWFVLSDAKAGPITLRLDRLPNYGMFQYNVYESPSESILGDLLKASEMPIPPTVVVTGELAEDEAGTIHVQLEHFILDQKPCTTYQFMVTQ